MPRESASDFGALGSRQRVVMVLVVLLLIVGAVIAVGVMSQHAVPPYVKGHMLTVPT